MNKLEQYNQSILDIDTCKKQIDEISSKIDKKRNVQLGQLMVNFYSTDKQFVFGIGVLSSRIKASEELGITDSESKEDKDFLLSMFKLKKDVKAWEEYLLELNIYSYTMHDLLSNDEKASLLKYPSKPN